MDASQINQAMNEAVRHHQAGRLAEAEGFYRQILIAHPKQPDALHLLGVLAMQVGRLDVAIDLINQAISQRPDFPAALSNLGSVYQAAGQFEDAIRTLQRAVQIQPDLFQAWGNLSNAFHSVGRYVEAIRSAERAISIQPANPIAHNSLGSALRLSGHPREAMAEYEEAIRLNPNYAEAHCNLGNALRELNRTDEAIACFQKSISLQPGSPEVLNNLAGAFEEQGKTDEAIATYGESIQAKPDFYLAHQNLGILLLREQRFAEGWEEFEWRLHDPELVGVLSGIDLPHWDGSPLNGKRILIVTEQGFGDTFQFLRYLPQVLERGGQVVFRCQPELRGVLKNIAGVDEWSWRTDPPPKCDCVVPLLSLPRLLKVNASTMPSAGSYIPVDPESSARWKDKLGARKARLRVGLAWSGRAEFANNQRRSISLAELSPLAEFSEIEFFSLQKGPAAEQLASSPIQLRDEMPAISDFAETAGLMDQLDLIITVDTSVAHLAGAIGKKVFLLLHHVPDWRWFEGRDDSPWYPSMRLFRQDKLGEWGEPVQKLVVALREELRQTP